MSYLNKLNILKCHCENSDHLFINENKICCKKKGCFHNDIKNAYTVFNDVPILISIIIVTAFDPNDIQSQVKRSKSNKFIEIVKKYLLKNKIIQLIMPIYF